MPVSAAKLTKAFFISFFCQAINEALGLLFVKQRNSGSVWWRVSRTKPPHRTATYTVSSARTFYLRSAA